MSTPTNQQTDTEQLHRQIEDIRRELNKTVAQLASTFPFFFFPLSLFFFFLGPEPRPLRAVAPQPDTDVFRRQLLLAVAGALAVGFLFIGRRSA